MEETRPSGVDALRRVVVVAGAFGSGKTELCLNLALHYRRAGPVALADLDLINPYFKSSRERERLAEAGVRLISPRYAMTSVDVPALLPEVTSIFHQGGERAVVDVGGDENGAVALGRYAPYFAADPPDVLLVVNARRPMSSGLGDLRDLAGRIARKSGLAFTGLVNNANLQEETSAQDVLAGHELLERFSGEIGVPVRLTCGRAELRGQLPPQLQAMYFPVTRYLLNAWERDA